MAQQESRELMDAATGEVYRVPVAVLQRRRGRPGAFIQVSKAAAVRVCGDRRLSLTACKLLLLFCGVCDYHNYITLRQREMGVQSGLSQGQVSRALRLLLQGGYVTRERRTGYVTSYRLSATLAAMGDLATWYRRQHYLARRLQPRGSPPSG